MRIERLLMMIVMMISPFAADAAQPAGGRLLALVPEDAQIVTGVKASRESGTREQLSLVTHNNNVDFADWLGLASVDPRMSGSDVVEAAASSPRGELVERLLLVDGRFDAARVFRAARAHGATDAEFAGVHVMVVIPFARNNGASVGVRWMAMPDDRTAIFGTPLLVQKALNRWKTHAEVDTTLSGRIETLRADAEAWAVMAMPPELLARHLREAQSGVEWARALSGCDDLVIGIHYGARARIDFVAHAERDPSKAGDARPVLTAAEEYRRPQIRITRYEAEQHRVTGTIAMPAGTRQDGLATTASVH